jgi:hypothetical protein
VILFRLGASLLGVLLGAVDAVAPIAAVLSVNEELILDGDCDVGELNTVGQTHEILAPAVRVVVVKLGQRWVDLAQRRAGDRVRRIAGLCWRSYVVYRSRKALRESLCTEHPKW